MDGSLENPQEDAKVERTSSDTGEGGYYTDKYGIVKKYNSPEELAEFREEENSRDNRS